MHGWMAFSTVAFCFSSVETKSSETKSSLSCSSVSPWKKRWALAAVVALSMLQPGSGNTSFYLLHMNSISQQGWDAPGGAFQIIYSTCVCWVKSLGLCALMSMAVTWCSSGAGPSLLTYCPRCRECSAGCTAGLWPCTQQQDQAQGQSSRITDHFSLRRRWFTYPPSKFFTEHRCFNLFFISRKKNKSSLDTSEADRSLN